MSIKLSLRNRIMANWLVLSVNVALLALLVFSWVVRMDRSSAATDEMITSDQKITGMDVYCSRGPFALFVNKDFPHKQEYSFCDYDMRMFLTCKEMAGSSPVAKDDNRHERNSAARNITLGIGDEFSISCSCTYVNGIRVGDLVVTRNKGGVSEAYMDLNADGFPDGRITCDEKSGRPRSEIWYDGKWQEAIGQGEKNEKYQQQLLGVGTVEFDMQRGRWVHLAQETNSPAPMR